MNILHVEARAIVAHEINDFIAARLATDRDHRRLAAAGEFECVGDQVDDDLNDPVAVLLVCPPDDPVHQDLTLGGAPAPGGRVSPWHTNDRWSDALTTCQCFPLAERTHAP